MAVIPVRWGTRQTAVMWVPTTANDVALAVQAVMAELIGALGFVFIAGSVFIIPHVTGTDLGLLPTALAIGLSYGVMTYLAMPASGGHINPAITLGALIARRIPLSMALSYIAAQILGAIFAGLLLQFVYRDFVDEATKLAVPILADRWTVSWAGLWKAGILEAILSFLLVMTFFATAVDYRGHRAIAGFATGLVLTFAYLAFAPLTGAVVNPLRYLGPAFAAFHWNFMAWYLLSLAGGLVAGLVYGYIFLWGHAEEEEKVYHPEPYRSA